MDIGVSILFFLKLRRNQVLGVVLFVLYSFFINAKLLFCCYPSTQMERLKYIGLRASFPARHWNRMTNFCGVSPSQPHTGFGSLEPSAINKCLQRTFIILHLIYCFQLEWMFLTHFPALLYCCLCHLYFPPAFNKQVTYLTVSFYFVESSSDSKTRHIGLLCLLF